MLFAGCLVLLMFDCCRVLLVLMLFVVCFVCVVFGICWLAWTSFDGFVGSHVLSLLAVVACCLALGLLLFSVATILRLLTFGVGGWCGYYGGSGSDLVCCALFSLAIVAGLGALVVLRLFLFVG